MPGVLLRGVWRCLEPGCPHGGEGTPAEADKAARLHTEKAPKHATSCSSTPADR